MLAAMIFIPGFPKAPFITLALGAGLLARKVRRSKAHQAKADAQPADDKVEETPVEELLDVDKVAIQVGARLIKTIDPRRKNSLSHRIAPLRRKFAQEHGIVLPLVRLRDNPMLGANEYEIRLNNHVVATGHLESDKFLAMDPGTVDTPIDGEPGREPVFDLPALWITESQKAEAQIAGYTVVDPESVLVTHISETLRRNADELLSRDDVQQLVDRLGENQPTLVNSVVGDVVSIALLHRVLQQILRDGLPIRDLAKILESLGDNAGRTKDISLLTEMARKSLVRTITEQYTDDSGRLVAMVLEPSLEYELKSNITHETTGDSLNIAPDRMMELCRAVAAAWRSALDKGHDSVVLLCDFQVRPHLAGILVRQIPQLPIIAYDEVVIGTNVESVESISMQAAQVQDNLVVEGAGV